MGARALIQSGRGSEKAWGRSCRLSSRSLLVLPSSSPSSSSSSSSQSLVVLLVLVSSSSSSSSPRRRHHRHHRRRHRPRRLRRPFSLFVVLFLLVLIVGHGLPSPRRRRRPPLPRPHSPRRRRTRRCRLASRILLVLAGSRPSGRAPDEVVSRFSPAERLRRASVPTYLKGASVTAHCSRTRPAERATSPLRGILAVPAVPDFVLCFPPHDHRLSRLARRATSSTKASWASRPRAQTRVRQVRRFHRHREPAAGRDDPAPGAMAPPRRSCPRAR